ncbi:Uncharacterised protein [Actinobaculum suis]|uniref:Uncharacterized protein n=1 Tax=Actinobaculum suis TaxID=1657 RepID=A0A7Z8Y9V4_9ACTO|nr:Uncharacterised protein [Actinobaculum suis]
MGRQRLRLIRKMALHRPVGALGTVMLALVLVLTCVSVAGFISAYSRAVERGAKSNFGVYSRQVTGKGPTPGKWTWGWCLCCKVKCS